MSVLADQAVVLNIMTQNKLYISPLSVDDINKLNKACTAIWNVSTSYLLHN